MVVRLGGTDVQVVNSQRYRVLQGQALSLLSVTLAGVTLRGWCRIRYDSGEDGILFTPDQDLTADGTVQVGSSSDVARMDGWVTDALAEIIDPIPVETSGGGPTKRGQTYIKLTMEPFGPVLCSDYCYSDFGQVALGTYVPPGPAGGSGYLQMVTLADDIAPVTVTYELNGISTLRKIMAFCWMYNASSDVATRNVAVTVLGFLGDAPTGFTAGRNVWAATVLQPVADEDAMVFADEIRAGWNDNGTEAVANTASAPSPFPFWVSDDMDMDLVFTVGSANANDRHSIYVLQEEWAIMSNN